MFAKDTASPDSVPSHMRVSTSDSGVSNTDIMLRHSGSPNRLLNSMNLIPSTVLKNPPLSTPVNPRFRARMSSITLCIIVRQSSRSESDRNGSVPQSEKQPMPPVPGPLSPSNRYG